jgi:hypothetical protein
MLSKYAVKLAIFGLETFRLDELVENAQVPAPTAASVLNALPEEWIAVFKATGEGASALAPTYRLTRDGRHQLAHELCSLPELLPRVLGSPYNGTALALTYVRSMIGLLPTMPEPLRQDTLKGIDVQLDFTEKTLIKGLDASGNLANYGRLRLDEFCKLEQLMKLKVQVSRYRRVCKGAELPAARDMGRDMVRDKVRETSNDMAKDMQNMVLAAGAIA